MASEDADPPKDGEVLGPAHSPESPAGDNYIALISQYTERPDLLLDALEKHDPGFIEKMNETSAERAERMSNARFWFGGIQAYSGLVVSIIAALSLLGMVGYMVVAGNAAFWPIIALAVFYAVSQGGPSGFLELCRGIAGFFVNKGNSPD